MKDLDHWRLADELSVTDAVHLMLGCDPTAIVVHEHYEPTLRALQNAIRSNRIPARIRHPVRDRGWDEEPEAGQSYPVKLCTWRNDWIEEGVRFEEDFMGERTTLRSHILRIEPDWARTTVMVQDVRDWLSSRGVNSGFFFPVAQTTGNVPDYLDPDHPRYSPKLAATVKAWQAVEVPKGRSPKKGLEGWLQDHREEFSLSNEGVKQCAAVANWSKGGAPTTPGA